MTKAKDFSLHDQNGKTVKLSEFKGKWVVLYFYPKDNTTGCTLEAIDFTKLKKDFEKMGAVILGVSPDSKESHCGFIEKQNLGINLLSDPDKIVLKSYNVWGKKKMYGREFEGVIRSTFLIDKKGDVAYSWNSVRVAGHAQEVLNKLKELAK